MTETEKLIERLEAATGPDRELDRDLTERFYPTVATPDTRAHGDPAWRHPDFGLVRCEYYTASLDAALALVERVRPGAHFVVATMPEGVGYYAAIGEGDSRAYTAPTPAIALCLALLRTLETSHD